MPPRASKDGVYDIPFLDAQGKERTLGEYAGDVLLIVNTASYWGYTRQHGVLQALQKRYGSRGFRVLGFPCNDFGAEEPDDVETIQQFCSRNYGVTYEIFDKVNIVRKRGQKVHPLYRWLTSAGPDTGPVSWNFEKFLLDRQGRLIGRWDPKTEPDHPTVIAAIESALGK